METPDREIGEELIERYPRSSESRFPGITYDDNTSFVLGCQALYYKWAPRLRVKYQEFKDIIGLSKYVY
jgi:hypothetical protein